jgi:hypothetical protein
VRPYVGHERCRIRWNEVPHGARDLRLGKTRRVRLAWDHGDHGGLRGNTGTQERQDRYADSHFVDRPHNKCNCRHLERAHLLRLIEPLVVERPLSVMDERSRALASKLVGATYISQAADARRAREAVVRALLEHVRCSCLASQFLHLSPTLNRGNGPSEDGTRPPSRCCFKIWR